MKGWRAACKPNENVFFNLNKVTYFFNLPFNCHPYPLFEQTEIKNFIQFPDPIYDEISVPWWDNQMVIEELSIPFKTQHNSVILENVLSKNKERFLTFLTLICVLKTSVVSSIHICAWVRLSIYICVLLCGSNICQQHVQGARSKKKMCIVSMQRPGRLMHCIWRRQHWPQTSHLSGGCSRVWWYQVWRTAERPQFCMTSVWTFQGVLRMGVAQSSGLPSSWWPCKEGQLCRSYDGPGDFPSLVGLSCWTHCWIWSSR